MNGRKSWGKLWKTFSIVATIEGERERETLTRNEGRNEELLFKKHVQFVWSRKKKLEHGINSTELDSWLASVTENSSHSRPPCQLLLHTFLVNWFFVVKISIKCLFSLAERRKKRKKKKKNCFALNFRHAFCHIFCRFPRLPFEAIPFLAVCDARKSILYSIAVFT